VNPASGAPNPVGSSSIIFFALGSTATGLYAAGWPAGTDTRSQPPLYFYSIDPRTASATQIGSFGVSPGFYNWSFSTGSTTLYFADWENLYAIDTNSGAATIIGGTGLVIAGLTYENGKLYATSNGPNTVWMLNTISGAATMVSNSNQSIGQLAPLAPPVSPQILSQLAFGGGWYTALYFTNSSAASISFAVNFTADNGTPLNVPSLGGSSATVNLAPHATVLLEAPNTGDLVEGYATASLPAGVTGYGVFRSIIAGVPEQEAVVPLASSTSTTSTLIYDDTNYITAVAIVNPSTVPVMVAINVSNSSGASIGMASIPLAAGAKTEAALRDITRLSGIAGNRGSAQFTVTTGSVAVLGLRFNGSSFTSIPATQQ
jgi:hypothetical protein